MAASKKPTLITGMPRSGTTFMLRLLDQVQGLKMRPHLDDESTDIKGAYWSNEPNVFKKLGSMNAPQIKHYLESMEMGQGVPEDESMLIKHHEMVSRVHLLVDSFDLIVFCVRNNGWLSSAKKHPNTAYRATSGAAPFFMGNIMGKNDEQRIYDYGRQFNNVTIKQYKALKKLAPEKTMLFRYDKGRYDAFKILRRLGVSEGQAVRLSGQFKTR